MKSRVRTDKELISSVPKAEVLFSKLLIEEERRADGAERKAESLERQIEVLKRQAEHQVRLARTQLGRETLAASWKNGDISLRLDRVERAKEAALARAQKAECLVQKIQEEAEQALQRAAKEVQDAVCAKQQAEAERAEATTVAEATTLRFREELSQAQAQVLQLQHELATSRQQLMTASTEAVDLQRQAASWEDRCNRSSQDNLELQSRVQVRESSATQLVQQQEADKQVAKDAADIGEHAAEIPAASAAEFTKDATPARLAMVSPQSLAPWSSESLFGGRYDSVFSPRLPELQLALVPHLVQPVKPSCWIEELPEDGEGNGLVQLTAPASPEFTPAGGPDPLPCVPAFGSPAGGAAATGVEGPSTIQRRHTAAGMVAEQQAFPGVARGCTLVVYSCRKRRRPDVGQQTMAAMPVRKRSRLAVATSPDSGPPAPAAAPAPSLPALPGPEGAAAAVFCMGEGAVPALKKKSTVAKPAQHLDSHSSTQIEAAAGGFAFVFRAGTTPGAQAAPLAQTASLAATAGVTAAGGVQLAITPCRPSPAQGTPGTLAPLSRNSLWDAKYSEVFASPLPEWRVALGLSPGLPVVVSRIPSCLLEEVPQDSNDNGPLQPAAFCSPVHSVAPFEDLRPMPCVASFADTPAAQGDLTPSIAGHPESTPQMVSSTSGRLSWNCGNVKVFDSPLYEETSLELEALVNPSDQGTCHTPTEAHQAEAKPACGTELQPEARCADSSRLHTEYMTEGMLVAAPLLLSQLAVLFPVDGLACFPSLHPATPATSTHPACAIHQIAPASPSCEIEEVLGDNASCSVQAAAFGSPINTEAAPALGGLAGSARAVSGVQDLPASIELAGSAALAQDSTPSIAIHAWDTPEGIYSTSGRFSCASGLRTPGCDRLLAVALSGMTPSAPHLEACAPPSAAATGAGSLVTQDPQLQPAELSTEAGASTTLPTPSKAGLHAEAGAQPPAGLAEVQAAEVTERGNSVVQALEHQLAEFSLTAGVIKAEAAPMELVCCRKRGWGDVGHEDVSPPAVPLMKRARLLGAENFSPNIRPAVAPRPPLPALPCPTGSVAAETFSMGWAAMPENMKRKVAKPAQHTASTAQRTGPLAAAGVFRFVFGAGSRPEVQASQVIGQQDLSTGAALQSCAAVPSAPAAGPDAMPGTVVDGSSSLAAPSKTFSQVCTEAGLPTPSEACEEACSPSTEAVDVTPHLSHAAAAVLPTLGSEAAGTSEGVDGCDAEEPCQADQQPSPSGIEDKSEAGAAPPSGCAQAAPGPEGTPVPVELYSCCSASEAAGTDPILPKRNRASKDATSPAPSETSEEVDVATPSEADNESGEACVVVPGFQSSRPAAGPVPSDVEGCEAAQHCQPDQQPSTSGMQSMEEEAEASAKEGPTQAVPPVEHAPAGLAVMPPAGHVPPSPASAAAPVLGPLFPAVSMKRRYSMMQGVPKKNTASASSMSKRQRLNDSAVAAENKA
ncbi:hypothetical protein ABBQ38_005487 [Trebouxia sp. C0009 RCD-2024]